MTDHSPVSAPENDDRLERYLLGLLDEPAREALEAEAFTDRSVADALDEAETTLVDAYVAGTLSEGWREAFHQALGNRPRLQARVQVARVLAHAAPRTQVRRRWLTVLAAAAALIVVASIWLLQRAVPPEPPPAQTTSVTDTPADSESLPDVSVPPAPDEPKYAPAPPVRSVFAVTLPSGVSRAADIVDIDLPMGSTHLQLRVPIASGDDFERYRVRLRGPDNREAGVADPAPLAPDRTVWLTVPRHALADGLHDVAVEGLDAQGTAEPLTLQQVRIAVNASSE